MDWNLLIDIGKVVGGAIVALTTAWKIAPKIWASLVKRMMHEMQEQMNQMSDDIKFIASELRTNGGSSLRDAIDRNNNEHVLFNKTLSSIESMTWNNIEVQRARMDNDDEMIFITGADGNCTWVNRSYARHTGRTIEEIKGSGWVNVVHPAERERIKEAWYEAVKHNREFEMVIKYLDTAGVTFSADVRSYKMTSSDGKTTGFMGVGEVIRENKIGA